MLLDLRNWNCVVVVVVEALFSSDTSPTIHLVVRMWLGVERPVDSIENRWSWWAGKKSDRRQANGHYGGNETGAQLEGHCDHEVEHRNACRDQRAYGLNFWRDLMAEIFVEKINWNFWREFEIFWKIYGELNRILYSLSKIERILKIWFLKNFEITWGAILSEKF